MTTKKLQAIAYMKEGKYAEAIPLLFELESDEIKDWTLYYAVGKCYMHSGQVNMAYRYLETARQINRLNAEIVYAYGEACMLLPKYDEAIKAFEDVICLHPNRVAAYNKIGLAYARMGKTEEALEWFHKGLKQAALLEHVGAEINDETYRNVLKAKMELGFVFPNRKPEDTMDLQLIKAIILNNIGVCHFEQHAREDAKPWFERALSTLPEGVTYPDPVHYIQQMEAEAVAG